MPQLTPRGVITGALALFMTVGCSSASADSPPPGPPSPAPEAAPQRPIRTPPPGDPTLTDQGPGQVQDVPTTMRFDPDTIEAGRFDQGKMWTFEFPPLDYLSEAYGLSPDSSWFRRARLGALRIPSCSASFVSPYGLVLTNHHCAREFVSQVAEEEEGLLDDGFFARSLEEERPVEDFEADMLVEIVDITDEVEERTLGLSGANLVEARENVLEEIGERIQEERGGEDAGWVVEAISLYNGAHFSAYVFRRYTNAKLVMAPELQIGFFGGDPDNFTYPRYNLDFSFFRIYDDDGEPLEPEVHFNFAEEGVEEGDPIFIIGNPGSTSRLQTVSQLEFRRDVEDRSVLAFVGRRIEVLEAFIEAYPDEAEELDLINDLFSLQNTQKAMRGQIEGLEDPVIIARRAAAERDLMDAIEADSTLEERFGTVFEDMAELQDQKREFAPGFGAFLGLNSGDFESPTLYRALVAFQVLNGQRAGAPAEQLSDLMDELRGIEDRPAALDEAFIEARIEEFIEYYGEDSWVQEILQGRSPEGAATVIREESVLSDSASAVQAAERGTLTPNDPAIRFVVSYVPAFAEFQGAYSGISTQEEEIAGQVGRARFEVYGTSQPPDATFSLRLADGVVTGYPYNGTEAPPVTTLFGMYDRHYSFRHAEGPAEDSPWALPERWLQAQGDVDLTTPLDFVSTADIIGGNSGSPVLNEFLQVVGVVFDGNIESLPGDYIYLPELNRSVAVDARAILEALDSVYDMDRIFLELTEGRLAATEEEADQIRR